MNVLFQGKDLNVQDLVESEEAKKVLDMCSIKELTSVGDKVIIPSFTNITSPYNPQLFIERRVILPIGKNFHGQLASEMGYSMPTLLKKHGQVDSQGKIEWAVQCSELHKIRVWKKMNKLTNNKNIVTITQMG